MKHLKNPVLFVLTAALFCVLALQSALAGNTLFKVIPGVNADINFSDTANWNNGTPANNVATFTNAPATNLLAGPADCIADAGYNNTTVSPLAWGVIFGETNGIHHMTIPPGVTFYNSGGTATSPLSDGGGMAVGAQRYTSNPGANKGVVPTANATNYAIIDGTNATLIIACSDNNGNRNCLQVAQGSQLVDNHYAVLDMSHLDNFIITNATGDANGGGRFLIVNGETRGQGLIYLAKTNLLYINADIQVGWIGGTYSNSLPIGLYLGQTNIIITGQSTHGNGNQMVIGIEGVTNAFVKFNPIFLGNSNNKPVAYLSGNGSGVSGMMNWVAIGQTSGGSKVPANAIADFTGGKVIWNINSLRLGRSGAASPDQTAVGTLSFDDGSIAVQGGDVGEQTVSSGSPAIGTINIGTNATFTVANTLYLPWITGTANPSSSGTINVNTNGMLVANIITNTGGTGIINLTNATLAFTNLTPGNVAFANVSVSTLNTGGSTNIISIASFTIPPTGFPFTNKLVAYSGSIGGAGFNFGLVMPAASPAYVAHLVNNTGNNEIDLVVNGGPAPARVLSWTGTDGSNPQNWDIGGSLNWKTNGGAATTYNQLDFVTFDDSASSSTVNLTTVMTPSTLTVSNNALTYTFTGSGNLSSIASGGLNKQGTGTLILDAGNDTYSGGVNINSGTVQVGNNDANGSLSGNVANGGALAFDRNNTVTITNLISGSGAVAQNGSGSVTLSAANTFTGNVSVNAGTLKLGNNQSLGTGNMTTVAANSTLDLNGFTALHNNRISAAGSGTSGQGAIDNSSATTVSPALTNLTLTGNATIGASGARWDLRSPGGTTGNPATSTLSTGSSAYSLTKVGAQFIGIVSTTVDPALGDVDVQAGTLDIEGNTTGLGNTASNLFVRNSATLEFWSMTNQLNKHVQFDSGAIVLNGNGNNIIAGPITFNGDATFTFTGGALTLNGALSGTGGLIKNSTNTLTLNGSDSHSGGTTVNEGTFILDNIANNSNNALTENPGQIISAVVGGNGTNAGPVDIEDTFQPSISGHPSTFGVGSGSDYPGADGALMFNASGNGTPSAIFDLGSSTVAGSSVNDLVVVNGNIDGNFAQIRINPLTTLNTNSPYTLITYTGVKNGNFSSNVHTVLPSRYSFTLSYPANQVTLNVSGGPASLTWNNNAADSTWNVQGSQNWFNTGTAANDVYYDSDSVTLDDSITNASNPSTAVNLTVAVSPTVVNNNSTTNYSINGIGKISGSASIVKNGTSTLTINTTNDFTGGATILGGTLKAAAPNSLGATNGTIIITNGATLDINYALASQPVIVSGSIVNNSGNSVFDSSGGLANITLTGDLNVGGTNRLDFGPIAPNSGTVSSGGNAYSITISGNQFQTYHEWDNLTVDSAISNINLTGGATLGVKGTTTLSSTTGSLNVFSNGLLQFYNDGSANVMLDRQILLYGGATLQNGGGTSVTLRQITLGTNAADNCVFNIGGTSLTASNVIGGPGNLLKFSGGSSLLLTATNTYTGNTVLSNGTLLLVDNGSISSSPHITDNTTIDVSRRNNQTLTLASGQTLQGHGAVNGNVTVVAGATISPESPGALGILTVTNNVTLSGTAIMDLNKSAATNDVIRGAANITYGGVLAVTNISGALAVNDQFKLFNAATYGGAFAAIAPSHPNNDSTLAWDTNSLAINGTLKIVTGILPTPTITSIGLNGTTLTITATNGSASGTFVLLQSTNVSLPLAQWTPVLTNTFDGSGDINLSTNIVNPDNSQEFYILQSQ